MPGASNIDWTVGSTVATAGVGGANGTTPNTGTTPVLGGGTQITPTPNPQIPVTPTPNPQ